MKTICVLPVRLKSTVRPNRPLAPRGGSTALQHCIAIAREAFPGPNEVLIASPDPDLVQTAQESGVQGVLTSAENRTAFHAVYEGLERQGHGVDRVIEYWIDSDRVAAPDLVRLAREINPDSAVQTFASRAAELAALSDTSKVKLFFDNSNNVVHASRGAFVDPRGDIVDIGQLIHQGSFAYRYEQLRGIVQFANAEANSPLLGPVCSMPLIVLGAGFKLSAQQTE